MKTVFLMRHGQTLFNYLHLNQGQCDSPLTEEGIRQAKTAGQWFKDNGIRFGKVYSSTSERACDTAELVSGMPYTRVKGLKEIYLGTKEAAPLTENPPYPYDDYFVQFGGESLEDVTKRIYCTVEEICRNEPADPLLIVSHGMAIRRFLLAIGYKKAEEGFIGNCGFAILHYDEKDRVFHLKDIVNFSEPLENQIKGQ